MNITNTFAKNMKNYREFLGLTQEMLAHKCGLDMSYIGRIERQVVCPTIHTVQKIANAMNIDSSLLMSEHFEKYFDDYALIYSDNGSIKIKTIDGESLGAKEKRILDSLCDSC